MNFIFRTMVIEGIFRIPSLIHCVQATTLQTVADLKSDIQNKEQIPMQD